VVDDEPLVGRAVSRILSPPHRVTLALGGAEALALLEAHRYDVVLCDLSLAEEDGVAVHRMLKRLAPGLARRTAFLTGGSLPAAARAYCEAEGIERLEKPFEVLRLRALVARLAAGVPGAEGDSPSGVAPV
jgi:CheY-like chemotaxis protein